MKTLYVEPFSGVSGNMMIGALLDVGLPYSYLQEVLNKMNLGAYSLIYEKVSKCGISATHFDVELPEEHHHATGHQHVHEHTHEHRNLASIEQIIQNSDLPVAVKNKAILVFTILAEAEAKVHGKSIEEVHFHEVGAIDTIIDIVGTIAGLEYLGVSKVYVGKIQTGCGFVQCAHGLMPIPAPATAELLRTLPYYNGTIEKELATPTGVALMSVLGYPVAEKPESLAVDRIGYGAGTWELAIPNVLRVHLGEEAEAAKTAPAPTAKAESLWMLETNIDDSTPEVMGYVLEEALVQGALDAWLVPIVMKKSRPAFMLKVLCAEDKLEALQKLIFSETSTLGLRSYPVGRTQLAKESVTVVLPQGSIRVNYARLEAQVVTISPEYEDCKKAAQEHHMSVKTIMHEAAELARISLHG